eukprot:4892299-Amphidinium_carterae.1
MGAKGCGRELLQDVVALALQQDAHALQKAHEELKGDRDLVLMVLLLGEEVTSVCAAEIATSFQNVLASVKRSTQAA